jgi:hypothetical protein
VSVPRGAKWCLGRTQGRSVPDDGSLLITHFEDQEAKAKDPLPWDNMSASDHTCGITNWLGMLGNDQWGDCVVCAYIRFCMIQAVMAGIETVENGTVTGTWPTTQQALTAYWACQIANGAIGPQPDNGLDITSFLKWAMTHSVGPIPPTVCFAEVPDGGNEFASAQRLYGATLDGVLISQEAMNQAEADPPQEWTSTATDWIGGHGIPNVYRDASTGKWPTWGFDQSGTWPWWRAAKEESLILISAYFAEPLSKIVDLAALKAACTALGE